MAQHFLSSFSSAYITFSIAWSCTWCVRLLISAFRYSYHETTPVYRTSTLPRHRSRWAALIGASSTFFGCAFTIPSIFYFCLCWLRTLASHSIDSELLFVVPVKTCICFSKSCGTSRHDVRDIRNSLNFGSRYRLLTCASLFLFARLEVISPSTMEWNAVVWLINVGYVVSRKAAHTSIVIFLRWAWFARFTQDLFFKHQLFVSRCFTERHFSWRRTLLVARSWHSVLRNVVVWWDSHSVLVRGVKSIFCEPDLSLLILLNLVQAIHFARNLLLKLLYHLAYLEVFIALDFEAVVELIDTLNEFEGSFLG